MARTNSRIVPISPHAALLLEMGLERILVIADIHIGWEVALAEEGVHVPSQTPKILESLIRLIRSQKPSSLIIVGDVKHTIAKIEMEEWRDVPEFFEQIGKLVPHIRIIPGNHDGSLEPLLPENIEILPQRGTIIWDVGLFHGHTWPAPEMLKCSTLIIGHVHPIVTFRDPVGFRVTRQVWVKAKCNSVKLARFALRHAGVNVKRDPARSLKDHFNVDLKASQFFIMPSFNDFLGGQTINRSSIGRGSRFREFIGPVLRSGSIDIDNAEVYLLDGTFLGTISQLRTLG